MINFWIKYRENLAGLVGVIVKNRNKDQVATKIPISGSFESADIGAISAIVNLLRNAFIQAIFPSIDYQISLTSVDKDEKSTKGFFKKLFGKDDKESKDKDDKK